MDSGFGILLLGPLYVHLIYGKRPMIREKLKDLGLVCVLEDMSILILLSYSLLMIPIGHPHAVARHNNY